MMASDADVVRLGHMLDACRDARRFAGDDRDEFLRSYLRQAATIRALQVLGDAAKGVSAITRGRFPDVPWRGITGMRDMVVHHYFGIQIDLVWEVVEDRLPKLEGDLISALASLE